MKSSLSRIRAPDVCRHGVLLDSAAVRSRVRRSVCWLGVRRVQSRTERTARGETCAESVTRRRLARAWSLRSTRRPAPCADRGNRTGRTRRPTPHRSSKCCSRSKGSMGMPDQTVDRYRQANALTRPRSRLCRSWRRWTWRRDRVRPCYTSRHPLRQKHTRRRTESCVWATRPSHRSIQKTQTTGKICRCRLETCGAHPKD